MTPASGKPMRRARGGAEHPLIEELRSAIDLHGPATEQLLAKVNREMLELPELWGASEVAEYLGIAWQNLYKRPGLPAPAYPNLNRGRLWLASDIREYRRQHDAKG